MADTALRLDSVKEEKNGKDKRNLVRSRSPLRGDGVRRDFGKVSAKIADSIEKGRKFYSVEFFPPHTIEGARGLMNRMDRMANLQPKPDFLDVTWTLDSGKRTMEMLVAAKALCAVDVQMHLTCTGITKAMANDLLSEAVDAGVRSILALRGDAEPGQDTWNPTPGGFNNAGELVAFIRQQHGDFFSIAVAGHPAGHPSSTSREEEMRYLKAKVDAGADYIVTQIFFEASEYISFVAACRAAGITCPVVPGILVVPPSLEQFETVCRHCQVAPASALLAALRPVQHDPEQLRAAGLKYMEDLSRQVLQAGAPGLYLYSLNLERSVKQLVTALDLSKFASDRRRSATGLNSPRPLPWARARDSEVVRPIFWASNPLSYLHRTWDWHCFPSSYCQVDTACELQRRERQPSDVDVVYSNYSLVGRRLGSMAERRNMWGEAPSTEEDIFDVFESFIWGRVPRLPWCEQIETETVDAGLIPPLAKLNHNGFLTINSQPRINGVSSSHACYGWGPEGGLVYQKAYLEFFCSPLNLERLIAVVENYPAVTLQGYNRKGERRAVMCRYRREAGAQEDERHVTAVTWGVFDGIEVLQPTVVDSQAFEVWKDEAFEMWESTWMGIYPEGSAARALLQNIHDTYWHVYVVDNDFVKGNLLELFSKVLGEDLNASFSFE